MIKAGRVTVNGRVGQLNDDVTDANRILVDNKRVKLRKSRYILLYKPVGYITTLQDQRGRPKVADLVDVPERVVPVGRLDKDTTGVLILTNDGRLAHKLMHPSFGVKKVYEAEVTGKITDELLNKLSNGIALAEGPTAPAKARRLADNKVELIIHEGRNHQVKRMLAAVGLKTIKLHRRQYGPLTLGGLKPGDWRDLSDNEIQSLG